MRREDFIVPGTMVQRHSLLRDVLVSVFIQPHVSFQQTQ